MGFVRHAMGRSRDAVTQLQRARKLFASAYPSENYPEGHPSVAACLTNLGEALRADGKRRDAVVCFEQALTTYRRLYPATRYADGHLSIVVNLNHLGESLLEEDDLARAAERTRLASPKDGVAFDLINATHYLEESVRMAKKLYPKTRFPDGHPTLAASLNHLAEAHTARGDLDQAEAASKESLDASRSRKGQLEEALSLANLGEVLARKGDAKGARDNLGRALALFEKLFPAKPVPNHPVAARVLLRLGEMLAADGDFERAENTFGRLLEWSARRGFGQPLGGIDPTATELRAASPRVRDFYLSVIRGEANFAVPGYALVWQTKAVETLGSELRRMKLRSALGKAEPDRSIQELYTERENLLLAPTTARPEVFDKVGTLDAEIAQQEKALMPSLKEAQSLLQRSPVDLRNRLPANAVFVDLFRYSSGGFGQPDEKRVAEALYVAFVVSKLSINRVELGPARTIETALAQWREAITTSATSQATKKSRPATERDLAAAPPRLGAHRERIPGGHPYRLHFSGRRAGGAALAGPSRKESRLGPPRGLCPRAGAAWPGFARRPCKQ
jgi:tetratricopeptide (TPR) repeat protein